ncbi:MAG TPA: DEAD/DEAH box helicase [Jatrophihabitans sp.]|nr:DEAD/DEAH box helicase [Jatrophihabitans sp.]
MLEQLLLGRPPDDRSLRHVEELPARPAQAAHWPEWVPEPVLSAYLAGGIEQPWPHQVAVAESAWSGRSVIMATGTASGKSLAYQMPVLTAALTEQRSRSLYLAPTKALAADQLRALAGLNLSGLRAVTLDGDTPMEERDWIRQHANLVLSNPDLLHRTLLPRHAQWADLFRRLRFVVLDESHHYRGVFGSHVALVLRRLRRLCARYGSQPTFILASATSADPAASAERLTGLACAVVEHDLAPRGRRVFALWEPPLTALRGENSAPVRRAAGAEAARLVTDLTVAGARTLTFVRSRRSAELTALAIQRALREAEAGGLAERVAAYRGGYLAEERRQIERALASGELLAVATTNALELGIDITGLDAVVLAGFPGTLSSLWQQAGRAGRRGQDALVVFVARDDPLDTYLVNHPESIFARPVELGVIDPLNPHVLAPQLCAAAFEAPLTEADLALFGADKARATADALADHGLLRRRPRGWFWLDAQAPRTDIRSGGGHPVTLVEDGSGTLLGTVDAATAPSTVHDGAVYLHQGRSFIVDRLDLVEHVAVVHAEEPDWTTTAREITDIRIIEPEESQVFEGVSVHLGSVEVSHQVVSYQRRRWNGEIMDEIELDLPMNRLQTKAVWYTVDPLLIAEADLAEVELPGALHAAEHAAIGLLPLFASCDRWDIGGVSTALHADTERPTVFVYDGHAGGAGFAARGHAVLVQWLQATRDAIAACECRGGCPSCVQSPKCGNGNNPLDKDAALIVLRLVLDAVA